MLLRPLFISRQEWEDYWNYYMSLEEQLSRSFDFLKFRVDSWIDPWRRIFSAGDYVSTGSGSYQVNPIASVEMSALSPGRYRFRC